MDPPGPKSRSSRSSPGRPLREHPPRRRPPRGQGGFHAPLGVSGSHTSIRGEGSEQISRLITGVEYHMAAPGGGRGWSENGGSGHFFELAILMYEALSYVHRTTPNQTPRPDSVISRICGEGLSSADLAPTSVALFCPEAVSASADLRGHLGGWGSRCGSRMVLDGFKVVLAYESGRALR